MSTTMSQNTGDHITKTEGVCGGRPCIAGHRIRVADIVVWHEMRGYSADEVVALFPGLTLSQVYSALAYYFDHRQEIDADLAAEDVRASQSASTPTSRLREKRRSENSIAIYG